jgi:hypothetical protein
MLLLSCLKIKRKKLKTRDVVKKKKSSVESSVYGDFDFSRSNDAQKEAIQATDGPVLITAGPGTGKTFTLVQRALYLIAKKGVKPERF